MDMMSFDRTISSVIKDGIKFKAPIDMIGQTIIADSWAFNRLSNDLDEGDTDRLIEFLLAGDYALGDAAFQRRNGGEQRDGLLSEEWESAIRIKWNDIKNKTAYFRGLKKDFEIRQISLPEFQRVCRLNANAAGNMVDEITGVELAPNNWSVDRAINRIVPGISGCYQNSHFIITHSRMNDMKEAGGRKIFASVETLNLEKLKRHIVEPDNRLAIITILREYLDQIRKFRSSKAFFYNMHRLQMKKLGIFEDIRSYDL
jgi:hypothetical protein